MVTQGEAVRRGGFTNARHGVRFGAARSVWLTAYADLAVCLCGSKLTANSLAVSQIDGGGR